MMVGPDYSGEVGWIDSIVPVLDDYASGLPFV